MREDTFWQLVDRPGGARQLSAALRRLSAAELVGFHESLCAAVTAVDTAAHRAQPVADLSGGTPGHLSDDAFEDLRLAVVAAGRTRWAAAVADPSTVAGVWPLAAGEEFGHAVAEAYERATGDRWPGLDVAPDTGLVPATRYRWLMILPSERWPEPYHVQLEWLERKLNQPAWEQWWDTARDDGAQLVCYLEFTAGGRRRASLRTGRDPSGRVEVSITLRLPRPTIGRPGLDPTGDHDGWAALTRAHAQLIFDTLQAKTGLGDPPPLPPAADLERERQAAAAQDAADADAFVAWNLERTTAVPTIWAGRAPDHAIRELIDTLRNGGRIRIPAMIAAMRTRYAIPADPNDARLLTQHGYNTDEIGTALT